MNKPCNSCGCPTIKDEVCFIKSTSDLLDVVNSIDNYICKLSDIIYRGKCFGHKCSGDEQEKITKLLCYKDSLDRYLYKRARGVKQCLNSEKISCIVESVKDFVPKLGKRDKPFLLEDSSLEYKWISENPCCVPYEKWNKYSRILCNNLKLDIKVEEEACNLSLELSREMLSSEVLLAAKAYKEVCDLNLELNRTQEECKLDWNILVKEEKCDLDLKGYLELTNCGLSFDIIKEVYNSGCSFKVTDSKDIYIKGHIQDYKFCDLSCDEETLKNSGFTPECEIKKYLQDYNKKQ